MENRIYGETVDINKDTVKKVFEKMSKEAPTPLCSCMLDVNNQYAETRNTQEIKRLHKLFVNPKHVLDICCGYGRLRSAFPEALSYTGVDFCSSYIDMGIDNASKQNDSKSQYICSEISKIADRVLPMHDLVLCCGALMYLSDTEVLQLFNWLKKFKRNTNFYIRESVSIMDDRLTLNEFDSKELGTSYSAIYRTSSEYISMIQYVFGTSCNLTYSSDLQQGKSQMHKETNQRYFIWTKK